MNRTFCHKLKRLPVKQFYHSSAQAHVCFLSERAHSANFSTYINLHLLSISRNALQCDPEFEDDLTLSRHQPSSLAAAASPEARPGTLKELLATQRKAVVAEEPRQSKTNPQNLQRDIFRTSQKVFKMGCKLDRLVALLDQQMKQLLIVKRMQ